ncbi:MAG: redoxin domain-containing protein [Methanomassiliicoccales archaeon]
MRGGSTLTVEMTGRYVEDFTLNDQDDEEFRLSGFIGRKVLLSFHPLAWTSVCSRQMVALDEEMPIFDTLDTTPVGISVDSVPCKKAWTKSLDLKRLPLLSDFWPHGEVARKFNVFREEQGFSDRANIIIDEDGKVAFFKVYQLKEQPDINEIIDLLRG